jgi:hypothetical protein
MVASPKELPSHALATVSFAENLAREYCRQGGDTVALFAAFAGLVSARDKIVGADCLMALDRRLFGDAKPESASPSA